MINISKEIEDYMNYLSLERQLSPNTIDGYKRDYRVIVIPIGCLKD